MARLADHHDARIGVAIEHVGKSGGVRFRQWFSVSTQQGGYVSRGRLTLLTVEFFQQFVR